MVKKLFNQGALVDHNGTGVTSFEPKQIKLKKIAP